MEDRETLIIAAAMTDEDKEWRNRVITVTLGAFIDSLLMARTLDPPQSVERARMDYKVMLEEEWLRQSRMAVAGLHHEMRARP